ncbi:hypothetical protein Pma05_63240 [Plantactinospora mayteni]|uniref:Uncharacterized protein n=1 Tax=Plantactinospora mayteni TaxID=566021 RepID=A0ABQ4EYK5_9ACTN|nr:hypothetical protein Pma05_63240 [Plantactinospora mayteni]
MSKPGAAPAGSAGSIAQPAVAHTSVDPSRVASRHTVTTTHSAPITFEIDAMGIEGRAEDWRISTIQQ